MKHKRICYLLLGALSLSLLGCGKTTYVAEMPDGRIVGLEEEEAEAIMEFQEEAGITELQEEYEQYMQEEYEKEMREELEQLEALQAAEANVDENADKEFALPDPLHDVIGELESKGVKYEFYNNIGDRGELGASCEIYDSIYELEEEVEFEGVIYPVTIYAGSREIIQEDTFTVPSHIKYVDSLRNIRARNITIPDTVEYINTRALFSGNELLESFTIPDKLECYGYYSQEWESAFSSSSNIKSVIIPEGTIKITSTFDGHKNVEEIILPDSLEVIGQITFRNCKNLTSINIPNNVRVIGKEAFAGCESLSSIELPDGLEELNDECFDDCTGITELILPDSVTKCPDSFGCPNLKLLVYPKNVVFDNDNSFYFKHQEFLEKIVFPNTITDLDADFPDSVKTIEVPEDLVDYLQKKYPDIEILAREK